ncbi:hypothetical protein [Nostoc sp.]
MHGEVINIRDVITFQGSSVAELKQAFADSVEDYLDFCRERGEEPDKPFQRMSEKFLIGDFDHASCLSIKRIMAI